MKSGVDWYAHGKIELKVYFPEGDICCRHCPLCLDERDGLKRWRCLYTGELIFSPYNGTGRRCPIQLDESEEENHGQP